MKFNPDSPFFQFMNSLAAFIGLNVIFLITCLPIFTIGPALTALYTVTLKEARKEGGYIFSTYFKAFKENFRQSAAAFLIQLVLALVFLFNAHFWGEQNTVLGNALMFVMTALLVVLALTFMYCYPLMARFDNTLTQSMKNAFFVAITHPKFTLGLAGILAVYLFFCFGFSNFAKVFMILLGFSFLAYCNSMLLMKVFQDYEEEPVECILEKE